MKIEAAVKTHLERKEQADLITQSMRTHEGITRDYTG